MKQLIIFSAIFFLGIVKLYSQNDFRYGYIIKNNNDTIYGLIDYRGNKSNTKMCIFKKDAYSEKQEFTPNDLKAYRFIDSKYYISKPLKLDGKESLLFLEYLINGIVDIFYYRDNLGEHYLADFGDDKLYELKNEKKEVIIDNATFIKESKEYIGILKYSFRKAPSIAEKVDNINLDHKSLIKIAHDYHTKVCTGEECIIYEKNLPKIITKFGPLIGINAISISKLIDSPNNLFYLQNSQLSKSIYPSIGMFIKANWPNLDERLFFQYEVTYSYKVHKASNLYIDPVYYLSYISNITMLQHTIGNSGLIRYEFPKGKFRPTFQVGGFINYFFKVDYTCNLEVKWPWGDTYFADKIKESPFSKFDYGISLGLGVIRELSIRKEISIDLRYQRGFGLLQGINSNYFLINMGFQIGK